LNRVLIAEDEARIASFVAKGLKSHGFTTMEVTDGEAAVSLARDVNFDLLILDLNLPDIDGQQVLTRIRERGERLPVVILTARQTIADKIAGFDGGADDYVTKPFSFDELLVRVRARLRTAVKPDPVVLEVGAVQLDLHTRRALVEGRQVDLSAKEFLLAETFLRHKGQVLSREQILSRVWGYDHDPGSNVVDVYVGYLRKKLGAGMIETVRGMGYRLA
jgi:DNA-binding response OmpR family regulator